MDKITPVERPNKRKRFSVSTKAASITLTAALSVTGATGCDKTQAKHRTETRHQTQESQSHSKPRNGSDAAKKFGCAGIKFTNNGDTATFTAKTEGPAIKNAHVRGHVEYDVVGLHNGAEPTNFDKDGTSITVGHGDNVSSVTMIITGMTGGREVAKECKAWHQEDKL